MYYLTIQIVDWVDIFSRQRYRDIFLDSLRYCQQEKGLQVFAYVIMSNHVHMIVNSQSDNLSATIGDLKKFTSKAIIRSIKHDVESRKAWMLDIFKENAGSHKRNKEFQIWTHENHAVVLYTNKFIEEKLFYIHENPVRAGLVEKAEDYLIPVHEIMPDFQACWMLFCWQFHGKHVDGYKCYLHVSDVGVMDRI